MIAWRAFCNMLRAAARDPVWAIVTIVLSPIRAGKYVFGMIVATFIVLFVLSIGADLLSHALGFRDKSPVHVLLVIGASVVTAIFVFRMLTNPMIQHFGDRPDATHGSARFATDAEAGRLTQTANGLLVGRDLKTGRPLRYDGPAHLLTMAPTRSGKGVGTIIPNLLTADRSVICIDPKGENARIAGRARNRFGPVHVLDPFGVTGLPSAAFNPLAGLDPNGLDVAEEAATLAEALVYDAPGEAGEAHWNEEAKALIAGIVLYIASEEPQEHRTLATLREHLTAAPDAFSALLGRMQGTAAAGGLIARAANRHRGKDSREAAGVLSAAQRHTHFLDSPRMTAVLDHSDFAFGDLKSRTATVFLVLPPDRLGTYARWLRLMVTQSLQDMARTPGKPPAPGPLPARRVRRPGLPGPDRASDGPDGRLWGTALADLAGRSPAPRHLRPARRHLPEQCRRLAGIRRQRSRQRPPGVRSARPGNRRVPDHEPGARQRAVGPELRRTPHRPAAAHSG